MIQDRIIQDKLLWYWIIFGFIRFFMDKRLFWYFREFKVEQKVWCCLMRNKNFNLCRVLASSLSCSLNNFINQTLCNLSCVVISLFFSVSNSPAIFILVLGTNYLYLYLNYWKIYLTRKWKMTNNPRQKVNKLCIVDRCTMYRKIHFNFIINGVTISIYSCNFKY